jgi:hypothetical protein
MSSKLPELVLEQRPDVREPGGRPDLGVQPREVPSSHHELGENLITITVDKPP